MPVRMSQELQDVVQGMRQVVVRIPFDPADVDHGAIEVTATVRVPAVDSQIQVEQAAREMAKRAIEKALSAFPL